MKNKTLAMQIQSKEQYPSKTYFFAHAEKNRVMFQVDSVEMDLSAKDIDQIIDFLKKAKKDMMNQGGI